MCENSVHAYNALIKGQNTFLKTRDFNVHLTLNH